MGMSIGGNVDLEAKTCLGSAAARVGIFGGIRARAVRRQQQGAGPSKPDRELCAAREMSAGRTWNSAAEL